MEAFDLPIDPTPPSIRGPTTHALVGGSPSDRLQAMIRVVLLLLIALVVAVAVWCWLDREDVPVPEPPERVTPRAPARSAPPPTPPAARDGVVRRASKEGGALPSPPEKAAPAAAPAPPGAWRIRGVCRTQPLREGEAARPVANARVTVWYWGDTIRRVARVVADEGGRYEASIDVLKDLSPARRGRPFVFVRAEKGCWMTLDRHDVDASLPVEDNRSFDRTVDLDLVRTGWVTGRVLDPAGQPVANVELQFLEDPKDPDSGYGESTIDVFEGRFAEPVLDLEQDHCRQSIVFRSDGVGVSSVCTIDVRGYAHVDLGDVTLRPAGTIAGVATYPDGRPARHLMLDVRSPDHGGNVFPVGAAGGYSETVCTDAAGRFRAVTLNPARYVVSSDEDEDYPELTVPLGARGVCYRVPTPRVLIRARDERGRPVSGIEVYVMRWRGAAALKAKERAYHGATLYELADAAVTYNTRDISGPDGIQGLSARPGEFWVVGIYHAGVEHHTRNAEILPGVFETVIDIPVRRDAVLGRLVITFDPSADPSPTGFEVWVESERTHARIDDCCGSYEPGEPLPGLPIGRYELTVLPSGPRETHFLSVRRAVDLHPGDNRLRLPVRRAGCLGLRIFIAARVDNAALRKSLRVRVVSLDRNEVVAEYDRFYQTRATTADAPGDRKQGAAEPGRTYAPSVHVALLRFGRYRILATAEGVAPIERTVTLEPGRDVDVTLRLR